MPIGWKKDQALAEYVQTLVARRADPKEAEWALTQIVDPITSQRARDSLTSKKK
jgi:hypothetical protein